MIAKRIAQLNFLLTVILTLTGSVISLTQTDQSPFNLWTLSALIYSLVAMLILARHPGHLIGWLYLFIGFLFSLGNMEAIWPFASQYIRVISFEDYVLWFGELLWIPTTFTPVTLVLLFYPDGRLLTRRWVALLYLTIFAIGGTFLAYAIKTWPHSATGPAGTIGQNSSIFDQLVSLLETVALLAFLVSIIGSLIAVVIRYRRSQGIERIQMKWLAYTAIVGISTMLVGDFISDLVKASQINQEILTNGNPVSDIIFQSLPALFALSTGIAILRHRLFDIDIIIRRTLQYAILTGILALIYFGIVVSLQSVFSTVGDQQSPIFIVISTLVIAGLFNPLRLRIQDILDRRFYRKKYEAEKALAQFATAARDEVDLNRLTASLLEVIEETMQPKLISLTIVGNDGE